MRLNNLDNVSQLDAWYFGKSIEVVARKDIGLASITVAEIVGEHPVFGFRRRYVLPESVMRDERQRLRVTFRYPQSGFYELAVKVPGAEHQRWIVMIDACRKVIPIPWDIAEMIAPILEGAREEVAAVVAAKKLHGTARADSVEP